MTQMMHRCENMASAAHSAGMFSCANIALIMDTMIMVSIIIFRISLQLRGLLIWGRHGKGAEPVFG